MLTLSIYLLLSCVCVCIDSSGCHVDMPQPCEIEQSTSGSISCSVNLPGQIEMRFKNLDAGLNKTEYGFVFPLALKLTYSRQVLSL